MTRFELISNLLCPYTQRAAIQLTEKGLPYERTYIDLAAKPSWFVQLSPLGKVPVLRVGGEALFETAVICEYIDDIAPATPMWSAVPRRSIPGRSSSPVKGGADRCGGRRIMCQITSKQWCD